MAHRLMYMIAFGIEQGEPVHHRCERHQCVNPSHLQQLAYSEHGKIHWEGRR